MAFALAWLLARGRFPGKLLLDGLDEGGASRAEVLPCSTRPTISGRI